MLLENIWIRTYSFINGLSNILQTSMLLPCDVALASDCRSSLPTLHVIRDKTVTKRRREIILAYGAGIPKNFVSFEIWKFLSMTL